MRKITTLFLLFTSLFAFALKVEITNPSNQKRTNEVVEVKWSSIADKLKLKTTDKLIVKDAVGSEIPSQIIYEGNETPQAVIFQIHVGANKTTFVNIIKGEPQTYPVRTFGRYVPERMDDYAWENDRVAFRMYGPALIKTDGPNNGIDIWCKRSEDLIVNKRYAKELTGKGSYHTDWGDGLDCYKVGRTLGAGAMAPFVDDSLWLAYNYVTQKTLDNGPLRTTFRLTYAPFQVKGNSAVTEIRTISLDAGAQLNKITEEYFGLTTPIPVVAGIVKRAAKDSVELNAKAGYAIYFEPRSAQDGEIDLAVIRPEGWEKAFVAKGHVLAQAQYTPNTKFTYYAGNGWSKWGFPTRQKWSEYIANLAARLQQPLIVTVK